MKRLILLGIVALILAFAISMLAGISRYGSIEGVAFRVRAEVEARRPVEHPDFVPTPIAPAPKTPLATAPPTQIVSGSATTSPANHPITPTTDQRPTTAIATITPTATATPTPNYEPQAAHVALRGLNHNWQTWNNCGPATLAMQLSYYGSKLNQEKIRETLRPNREDKNVSPHELVAYAQDQGYHATARVNGDTDLLKLLLSNDIPVLIETWLEPEPNDGMGHYRLLTGFDDATENWITYDSYISGGVKSDQAYSGVRIPYAAIDKYWPVFNNTYIIIYDNGQAPIVERIIAADIDDSNMWMRALAAAEERLESKPNNAYNWFNLGSDLLALGRYEEAAAAYDQARRLGLPWRMLWYQFGPFLAYYETGRFDEVLALANATLATTPHVEELHYWRGMALQALGDAGNARKAFKEALKQNSNYLDAQDALQNLDQSPSS